MSWTREAIYAALETQLKTQLATATPAGPLKTVGRRLVPITGTNPPDMPAVMIFQPGSRATQRKRDPQRTVLAADLFIYLDVGDQSGTVKSSALNDVLDAIDTALKPDPLTKVQTLGGLVSHCWTEGEAPVDEEVMGPTCKAMVPVFIEVGADNTGQAGSLVFDSGGLFVTPLRKGPGVAAPDDATPTELARLRDVTVTGELEMTSDRVASKLYAVFPMSKLRRLKVKASFAAFDGAVVDQVFFGATRTAGATLVDLRRVCVVPTIPSGGLYRVTVWHDTGGAPPVGSTIVKVPNGGTWSGDLGVLYAADGSRFVLVTGAPAKGQYSRSANVYRFAAADAGAAIGLSYTYTITTGTNLPLAQGIPGQAPTFMAVLQANYSGQQFTLVLNACVTTQFSTPVRTEEFAVMDFEFEAFPDSSGNVGTWNEGPLTLYPPVPGESGIAVAVTPAALDEGATYDSGIVGVAFTVANVGASPTLVWGENHYTTTGTRIGDTEITFTAPADHADTGYGYAEAFTIYVRDVDGHDHPSANTTVFTAPTP